MPEYWITRKLSVFHKSMYFHFRRFPLLRITSHFLRAVKFLPDFWMRFMHLTVSTIRIIEYKIQMRYALARWYGFLIGIPAFTIRQKSALSKPERSCPEYHILN